MYPHKVKYIQHGETIEQWALPDKQWWIDFADKWEHTEIIEFTESELTEGQIQRFEEISNDILEGFKEDYIHYIFHGLFPEKEPDQESEPEPTLEERFDRLQVDNTVLLMALTDVYAEIQSLKGDA